MAAAAGRPPHGTTTSEAGDGAGLRGKSSGGGSCAAVEAAYYASAATIAPGLACSPSSLVAAAGAKARPFASAGRTVPLAPKAPTQTGAATSCPPCPACRAPWSEAAAAAAADHGARAWPPGSSATRRTCAHLPTALARLLMMSAGESARSQTPMCEDVLHTSNCFAPREASQPTRQSLQLRLLLHAGPCPLHVQGAATWWIWRRHGSVPALRRPSASGCAPAGVQGTAGPRPALHRSPGRLRLTAGAAMPDPAGHASTAPPTARPGGGVARAA